MNPVCGYLDGVFDSGEIDQIRSILDRLPDTPNAGDRFNGYTNGFRAGDLVYYAMDRLVMRRLRELLDPDLVIFTGVHLKSVHPFRVHSDWPKGDPHPALTILIPLEISGAGVTHTVVFDQICRDQQPEEFLANSVDVDNNAEHYHDGMLSHEPRQNLRKLSVRQSLPWAVGRVIYLDRALLHASDNYEINGIDRKEALVLFCSRAQDSQHNKDQTC